MILEKTSCQPDVENREWRQKQLVIYRHTLEEVLKKYSTKIVGVLCIKTLKERYFAQYHHLSFFTSIISNGKMPICEFTWDPVTKEFEWINIVVTKKGIGIATQMRKMMEELASKLQARKLICSYIMEHHFDFWRTLRDEGYDLNEVTGTAFKKISPLEQQNKLP